METIFPVCVIGAGLAGAECAWQLAKAGIKVCLVEMRPLKRSPAHHTDLVAEMVCSNSFRSNDIKNAPGLLKEEMRRLDSLIMEAAQQTKVPAGTALAVDREAFSKFVGERLLELESLTMVPGIVVDIAYEEESERTTHNARRKTLKIRLESGKTIECEKCIIASGPLTDEKLALWIRETTGQDHLYFYDSIAPIVDKDSIDMTKAFKASRYGKEESGEGDYINCPMNKEEYERFVEAIANAELVELKDFDKRQFFEGCLPIEEMVRRGSQTLLFGPMKAVGLSKSARAHKLAHSTAPNDEPRPFMDEKLHAVVQLRQDNQHASLYNMVGFQTRMKHGEQKRIFRQIPGLEKAEFVRLGSMHRNTYLCSPAVLKDGLELKKIPGIHFAGQITGCEGYVESAAIGLYVGRQLALSVQKREVKAPPATTALGALVHHILEAPVDNFQPMNVNFGLFVPLQEKAKKKERKGLMVERALKDFERWIGESGVGGCG